MTFKVRVSCCKNRVDRVTKAEILTAGEKALETRGSAMLAGKFWTASRKFSAVHRCGEAEALMGVCHLWQHLPFRLSLAVF